MEEGCIEHEMFHTRIKLGVGEVSDESGKGEIVKWMREVEKLREINRRRIKRVRERKCCTYTHFVLYSIFHLFKKLSTSISL